MQTTNDEYNQLILIMLMKLYVQIFDLHYRKYACIILEKWTVNCGMVWNNKLTVNYSYLATRILSADCFICETNSADNVRLLRSTVVVSFNL
jgi:hypothetical protein